MSTLIKSILDRLDLDQLADDLDVKERSFRLARERGVFPAAWYPTVKRHCEAAKIACPMDAFNWKSPTDVSGPEVLACPDDVAAPASNCKGAA